VGQNSQHQGSQKNNCSIIKNRTVAI